MTTERIVECEIWGEKINVHYYFGGRYGTDEKMSIYIEGDCLYSGERLDLTQIEDLIILST